MSEIEEFDEQIAEIIEAITTTLTKDVPKLRGPERIEKCGYLKNRIQRSKHILKSMQVELRELEPDQQASWSFKIKQHEASIAKLTQDVEWAETSASKDDLRNKTTEQMQTKEITAEAKEVQKKTEQSADRAQKLVEETIEIGAAAASELKAQGEQIGRFKGQLEQVETNLTRADKQLRAFMRKMATDRIFLLFIFLLVCGIVAAICVTYVKPAAPKIKNAADKLVQNIAQGTANALSGDGSSSS